VRHPELVSGSHCFSLRIDANPEIPKQVRNDGINAYFYELAMTKKNVSCCGFPAQYSMNVSVFFFIHHPELVIATGYHHPELTVTRGSRSS